MHTPSSCRSRRLPLAGRRRLGAAALAVVLALVLGGLPVGAGHAEEGRGPTDISPSRFPTVKAVARIFPAYRGGTRELLRSRQLSVIADDCLYQDLAAVQPRAGRTAAYSDRRMESPFFSGGTNAVVAVYDFRKPRRAQAAFDEQREAVESCYGRHVDGGYKTTFTRLTAPRLAQDEFSYRLVSRDPNTGRDWLLFTYMRERRFLVLNFLQRDRDAPLARSAFRLARASIRAVS